MKNANQNQTAGTNHSLTVCEVCKETGKHGAQWLVHIEGQSEAVKAHKPCGETLLAHAPEGMKGRVVPSRELREVWARQRTEQSARSFWNQKFAQAKPISKPAVPAAPTQTAQAA